RLLAARHDFQARMRERLRTNLAALDDCVRRRPELSRLHAVGGWSATLRLPARRGEEEWALELLHRDVVVHPGALLRLRGRAPPGAEPHRRAGRVRAGPGAAGNPA